MKAFPIDSLIKKTEMTLTGPLLDYRQRKYVLRTLKLFFSNSVNQLLLLTFKYDDGNIQSD